VTDSYLATALEAAAAAQRVIREGAAGALEVRSKTNPRDLVTQVDTASERVIREIIARHHPDHAVLGEEGGDVTPGPSPYRWVVDPLDGTSNFVRGLPHVAVSIGLEHHGERILGVVAHPTTADLYHAVRGAGAFKNGEPLRVSGVIELSAAFVTMSFSADPTVIAQATPVWESLLKRAQTLRRLGSTALELALLAEGKIDVFVGFGQGAWDTAAGAVLVTEAGGQVALLDGGATCVAAASAALLDEVLSQL
jgi:myo-inositol-1(or 4)-monophosphatase